ncbi:alpha/beta hydrolase [Rhodococcus sp. ACPA4]|uniref:2-hydroxy-6-ketonona-2,4-dienoate hydrolase n=1 Tax=Rhodococcus globerulus TaxID=33008 RepID=O05145_RHOGO|nr:MULTISPECIES: alpha/beta fold hydrolase [unclassified Rhodococcus (in: high G+C Gram-positive bacteria)]AAB81313.1 2-hydroxy-6-ketonona-2,4-dienoate hydrolase [Rhodococcus globerulus]KJF24592.1 2-hydroxymuconic semialdehyde hydrolase [Rhodococcus sp. AD45]MDV8065315.1 alpha/beta fold hydrolase [Rhodococcus sp. IEGM 1366]NRI68514.1 alpha/beta fold hydrolase [Rhodococcus sp. MS16]PBC43460.1 alpha/beta hydrolase [Rhodococcus sp. ACPA4]
MTTTEIPAYITDDFFGLEDKWIETADGELTHYHELGEGTPILFLHGSGTGVTAAANWWLNLPVLSEQGRCIAIDSIGYGQSVVAPNTEYGIKEWVRHAVRVLDALGIEKTWIVGNSLGGWLAFQFAIDFPERLLGIVSMGTGGAKLTGALAGHSNPNLTEAGIRKTLELFVVDKSLVTDELVSLRYQSALNDTASDRLAEVVAARDRDRTELPLDFDVLSRLDVPVLLIHGVQDVVIPVSRTWELLNVIPNADVHIFSQCGHWSQVERAEEFNTVITQYLSARGVSRS